MVKILGALVLVGYLIRLFAAEEPLALPAPLGWLGGLDRDRAGLDARCRPTSRRACPRRCATCCSRASSSSTSSSCARGRRSARACGCCSPRCRPPRCGAVHFVTPGLRAGQRARRRPQRLRVPARHRAPAGRLPDRPGPPLPARCGCWRRSPIVAALLATLSRGALVGILALVVWAVLTRRVPIGGSAGGRRGARRDPRARARVLGAADRGARAGQGQGGHRQRAVARGAVEGRAADGGRPPAARHRPGRFGDVAARSTSSTR